MATLIAAWEAYVGFANGATVQRYLVSWSWRTGAVVESCLLDEDSHRACHMFRFDGIAVAYIQSGTGDPEWCSFTVPSSQMRSSRCERLGLNPEWLSDVYYVALLRFLGCTADAHEFAQLVGGDDCPACGDRAKCWAVHIPSWRRLSCRRSVPGTIRSPAGLVLGMMRHGKGRAGQGIALTAR